MFAQGSAMQRTDAHEGPAAAVHEEERGPVLRAVAWHVHAHANAVEHEVLALQHAHLWLVNAANGNVDWTVKLTRI